MPDQDEASLHQRIALTLRLDDLKDEARRNPLSIGDRRERVAEHCWHLAMASIIWASESPVTIDVPRAVMLATVHDFPELFVGDNSVYSRHEQTRPERELAAMRQFMDDWDGPPATSIFESWHEFESGYSAEATYVQALDVVLPILHNHANLEQSSWALDKIAAVQVHARIDQARTALPWLAQRAEERVEEARASGALRHEVPKF